MLYTIYTSKVKLNMENINSWKDIQWSIVEQKVFRLQLRIYKAALNQEWEKMYKLQNLLINSMMAKYLAVRRVTQDNAGKNTDGVDNLLIKSSSEKFELANRLKLDGKSSRIRRTDISPADGRQRSLCLPTIEDRAKQMLASLALNPQWEAQFEAQSYWFHPLDAIETVLLGISNKPKWVFNATISNCFERINYTYLLDKCKTYPKMRKQIRAWLKGGILDGDFYALPEMSTHQVEIISTLLVNIALHGLQSRLKEHIHRLEENCFKNSQALTYVRYANDFVLMYPDKKVLENLLEVIQEFLKPIGLELNNKQPLMVHTFQSSGFTFLGFDIIQKPNWAQKRKAVSKRESTQKFITLITPSKEEIKRHKLKIRECIRRYRGLNQERLIQTLNPIIRSWALSKCTKFSSKTFQALDQYVFIHLWKWARKRHPKMSKSKLKDKYWHQVRSRNWVFGIKNKDGQINIQLQHHSKIKIKRYPKIKGTASSFDGNLFYWAK